MALFAKARKSVSSILASFQKVDAELAAWEEVTKEEQQAIEARMEQNKKELASAKKAREALKAFVNV